MRRFVKAGIVLLLLMSLGCAATKNAMSFERRKELNEERLDWMKSTGMEPQLEIPGKKNRVYQ